MGMNICLYHFFQLGRLGDLQLGMTQEQIHQLLGQPDRVGARSRSQRQPVVAKYGDLELYFESAPPHICITMFIEAADGATCWRLPAPLDANEWALPPRAPRKHVEEYLHDHSLDYEEVFQAKGVPNAISLPNSGITIQFDTNDMIWSITVRR